MRCQPSPLCMHRADSDPVSHHARSVRSRNPSSISWWIDTGPDHVNVPLSEGCGGGLCLHPRTTCIRYAWLMHVESQGRRRTASLKVVVVAEAETASSRWSSPGRKNCVFGGIRIPKHRAEFGALCCRLMRQGVWQHHGGLRVYACRIQNGQVYRMARNPPSGGST